MNAAALQRLIASELRGRRLRAMALLFVVVTLSSAALVAGLQTQSRATTLWDDAFAEAHGAHVTAYAKHAALLQRVARDPRVVESTKPYREFSRVQLHTAHGDADLRVREMGPHDIPAVARPLLRSGRWVRAGAANEVVVERSFALDRGVHVGDTVVVRQAGRSVPLRVVGVAVDLIDCFYPQCDPTPVWLDRAAFDRFTHHDLYNTMFLRLRAPHAVNAFVTDVENRYGDNVSTNDWLDTRGDATIVSGFFGAFLSGFGVFVMVAAVLVVLGSMASRAIARRRDIGLMKAVGVTPRQVAIAGVVAHAVVAALGAVAGWILAALIAGRLQLSMGRVLGTGSAHFSLTRLLIAVIVVEIIVVGAILVPAWRTGRLSTTYALSPVATAKPRHSALARAGERLGLSPVATSGLRDAFARRGRSIFTVAALAVAVVAVVVSLGFNRTIGHAFKDPAYTGDPYNLVVTPQRDGAVGTIPRVLDADRSVAGWYATTERHGVIGDGSYLMRALSGDYLHAGYVVESGRLPTRPDEAIAGYGLLQSIGAKVGDTIGVRLDGRPVNFHIVGWYTDSEDTGQVLMFPLSGLQRVEPHAVAEAFFGHARKGSPPAAVAASLQTQLRGQAEVTTNAVAYNAQIAVFKTMFLIVTALVLVVAFVNLASTLLLAVRERVHDLGVLRSVGFTPRQVFTVTASGAAVLAFVAVVAGVPLGLVVYHALMRQVGTGSGLGPNIGASPAPLALALLVPLMVALGAALGAVVSIRAATAEVSDLVRYE
jgi:putative ABC transport system permease protein